MDAAKAEIDRLISTRSPYSVILPRIAQLSAAYGIPYPTLKTYLENKYIDLIRGRAVQKELLEPYGLPLVYINELIAKVAAPAAAPAAEEAGAAHALVNASQAHHAALTLSGLKGRKGGARRKTGRSHFSSKRRRTRRRRSTRRRR